VVTAAPQWKLKAFLRWHRCHLVDPEDIKTCTTHARLIITSLSL
jgi:hypothetical protein